MLRTRTNSGAIWLFSAGLAILLATVTSPAPAWALTPESPEVKAAVAKGMKFLTGSAEGETRTGGVALAGLAAFKDQGAEHPLVKLAIRRIQAELNKKGDFESGEEIYHLGISLVFLCTVDGVTYRSEIDSLLSRLLAKQKSNGAWGYPNNETGDTSMTQYGVLGLWESYRIGANPPMTAWENVCNWLLRTQDPSGAFGYQGQDPGNFTLVAQSEIRPSMAAAGLGSLYVSADHFGLGERAEPKDENKNVPAALKKKSGGRENRKPKSVDIPRLRAAIQRGDAWFSKNFTTSPPEWKHYYIYAYERYRSYKEVVEGTQEKEPGWYTTIASDLIKTQSSDGSWNSQAGLVPDTAFSLLFLVRGTRKSIQAAALGAGTLVGGRGLPSDPSKVAVRSGNVIHKPLSGPATQLLSVMEDPSNPEFLAALEGLAGAQLEPDDAQLPQHLARLRKLAGGTSPEARAIALRLLGRTRDLNSAPLLIFCLNDPDLGVVKEARDGLRFVSRKFDALGPEIPEGTYKVEEFEAERRRAIAAWKAWYLSIRPDHQFDD